MALDGPTSPKRSTSSPSPISSKALLFGSSPRRLWDTSPRLTDSPTSTAPASGASRAARTLKSDDFPQPFRPTTPTMAPGSTSNVKPSKSTRPPAASSDDPPTAGGRRLVRSRTDSTLDPSRGGGGRTMLPWDMSATARPAPSAAAATNSS